MNIQSNSERITGILIVLALHAAALYGLWSHRLLPTSTEAATVFVDFIAPPAPPKTAEPKPVSQPKPVPIERPWPQQLVAETPVVAPTDHIAPSPPKSASDAAIESPSSLLPAGPVTLGAELAVSCPERTAPAYPPLSRRMGETGTVMLRVELNEQGQVSSAWVETSSGYERLDQAALAAVASWHCQPPRRNGQALRAVARQPFTFLLQGN